MLRKISKLSPTITKRSQPSLIFGNRFYVHDWSHIYDGIYKFEDSTLGEDILTLRQQALDFAKKKLSPYAIDWEKDAYFPV